MNARDCSQERNEDKSAIVHKRPPLLRIVMLPVLLFEVSLSRTPSRNYPNTLMVRDTDTYFVLLLVFVLFADSIDTGGRDRREGDRILLLEGNLPPVAPALFAQHVPTQQIRQHFW